MELIIIRPLLLEKVILFLRLVDQLHFRPINSWFKDAIESRLRRHMRKIDPSYIRQQLYDNGMRCGDKLLDKTLIKIIRLANGKPDYMSIDLKHFSCRQLKLWHAMRYRFYSAKEITLINPHPRKMEHMLKLDFSKLECCHIIIEAGSYNIDDAIIASLSRCPMLQSIKLRYFGSYLEDVIEDLNDNKAFNHLRGKVIEFLPDSRHRLLYYNYDQSGDMELLLKTFPNLKHLLVAHTGQQQDIDLTSLYSRYLICLKSYNCHQLISLDITLDDRNQFSLSFIASMLPMCINLRCV